MFLSTSGQNPGHKNEKSNTIKSDLITIQEFASLVGSLNAKIETEVPALLCVKELQMYKKLFFSKKTITRTKSHSLIIAKKKFLGGFSNEKFGMTKK